MDPVAALIVDESLVVHPERARRLVVLDAPELAEAAAELADQVVLWSDLLQPSGAEQPTDPVQPATPAEALAGADLVWLRLPTALGALDDYAELVRRHAAPEVRLVAGGRVKHMTHSMNEVLAVHFDQVQASLGRQKSRVLHAAGPRPTTSDEPGWPRPGRASYTLAGQAVDLALWAHGATFAGPKLDLGSRLLLESAELLEGGLTSTDGPLRVLDLGSGNGVLSAALASRHPEWQMLATDISWAAEQATRRTAAANGVRVQTHRMDGLAEWPDHDLDLVVTNPPFHDGAAKDSSATVAMFQELARVLRPGGQVWCVHNSHLPWRARLRELVGPTEVVAQNRNYTLVRARLAETAPDAAGSPLA